MLSCFILFLLGFVTFWKTVALLGISLKVSSIYNEYREKHNKPFLADIFTIFISVLNRGLKCFFKGKKPAYLTTFCMSNEHWSTKARKVPSFKYIQQSIFINKTNKTASIRCISQHVLK